MKENKSTAQDFFLNLGVAITLYSAATSFLTLVFSIVNKLFPDVLSYPYQYDPYSSGVRLAMAALIIVFPLFLWLSRIATKIMATDESRREVAVRRWFVYITLFLASTALVIDLVTLLNYFLSGEITVRFILKILAVVVVAGIIFWHYLSEIRGKASMKEYRTIAWASAGLVVLVLISALWVFGSPANTRKLRMDDRRVADLQSIQWQILNQWQQKGTVPTALADLNDPLSNFSVPTDPETNASYEYEKDGSGSFKLCASFSIASAIDNPSLDGVRAVPSRSVDNWAHPAGRYCFERSIDPELYPIRAKTIQ